MRYFLTLFCCLICAFPVVGATPDHARPSSLRPDLRLMQNPIIQVQELLKELGFYQGTIDGVSGSDLDTAIKSYQRTHGLDQDGQINPGLISHLENSVRVGTLIQRLKDVRQQKKDDARKALLANPETRDLIESTPELETADPTRNISACLNDPNANCLIKEAVESSKAVYEDDMRDWALGEILASQITIGHHEGALKTTARIKDSRLVIAALVTISKTYLQEGKIDEAITGLNLIPNAERRIDVQLSLARLYLKMGYSKRAEQVLSDIFNETNEIEAPEDRLLYQIQASEIQAELNKDRALTSLTRIEQEISDQIDGASKLSLLRQNASTMAKIGYPEWALKILDQLPDDDARIPILMAASRAFFKMNRFEASKSTIERIEAKRYRSIILSDMALSLWKNGKENQARERIEEAKLIANAISLPFARNFALAQIANSLSHMAKDSQKQELFDDALSMMENVSDDRIRARGIWHLSSIAQKHEFILSTGHADDVAANALEEIPSKFSRAWVIGELVEDLLENDHPKQAKKAFDLGIKTISLLTNPWARSRAMAKFATLAHRLD